MSNAGSVARSAELRATISFAGVLSQDASLIAAWASFRAPLAQSVGGRSLLTEQVLGKTVQSRRGPVRSAQDAATVQAGFWRLTATNHRELGRSFLMYEHIERAREHVLSLQAVPDLLVAEVVVGPMTGSRGWIIHHRDQPVITCSRWYESTSTCAAAAERARIAFASAILSTAPLRQHRLYRTARVNGASYA